MKLTVYIINILLLLGVFVGNYFYNTIGTLEIKSITSAGFVLIGLINLIYALVVLKTKEKRFAIIQFLGLVFAMLGDIILEPNFILGAMFFAVGHILFFVAYCFLEKFNWKDLIPGVIIFIPATLFILLAPIFEFESVLMQIVCVVYAIIISLMLGKAISNFIRTRSVLNLIILIGSFLFLFSDLMLLLRHFANLSRIFGYLCLATYYPAECLLAHSILYVKKEKKD